MQDADSQSCVSPLGAGSSVFIVQASLASANAACRIALAAAGRLLFWLTSKQTSWQTRSQTFQMQQKSPSAASELSLYQPFACLSRDRHEQAGCAHMQLLADASQQLPCRPGRGLCRLASSFCSGRCPTCNAYHAGQGRVKASQQQLVQRSPRQAGASPGRPPLPILRARQHLSKLQYRQRAALLLRLLMRRQAARLGLHQLLKGSRLRTLSHLLCRRPATCLSLK